MSIAVALRRIGANVLDLARTRLELATVEADQFHRGHAVVELAIRD